MADKKKMSVAEILAAARKADGQGGDEAPPEPPVEETAAAEAPAADAAPAEESSAPAKIAKPGSPDRPSIAEMMKMARAEKAGGAKPAAKPAAAKPKPAAKSAAEPAAAKKEDPKQPVARDTASILAAARKANKPGPMSKSEAAEKAKSDPKPKPAKPPIVVPPMPTKPEYAKKPEKKAAKEKPAEDTRRGFLNLGFWMLGLVSTLWGLVTLKFLFPNVRREPPSKFKVGFPDGFAAGQVQTKFKAQYGVWVANSDYNGQQMIYALKSVCTHLGCTPNWLEAEQKFKCPCHGSGFYKDGINFEGPAPRPLERYAIRIADDGQIEIDKSKTFQEEMGQWGDPGCYIPV